MKQGVKIHGVKVLGQISDIPRIVSLNNVKQLIIALPSADIKTIKKAVDIGKKSGLRKIKIAPPLSEIMRGEVSLRSLKDVDVEDLLGRNPVSIDKKEIEKLIKGKRVMITGAGGSIGSELSRQTSKFGPSLLILLDQDETGVFNISKEIGTNFPELNKKSLVLDITDENRLSFVFDEYKPEIVFHAAAYKHVPLMEEQPDEAVKNNIFGTEFLVNESLKNKVDKFIFISTDKAVNPTSVMGRTKRIGEMICQNQNNKGKVKFISVRFGNVLNSRGSVIPIFKDQIKRGGPVEVTDPEMTRYFMLISEACLLVMQAGSMGKGGEVFVLDMGKQIKILDLAKEMIRLSGFEPDKDIPITFIGKRPGEKLFEEILTSKESVVATSSHNIFTAKMPYSKFEDFEDKLIKLKSMILNNDNKEIIEFLKNIIFIDRHS